MARSPLLVCSFCRKDSDHVKGLVAGPGVYICDACTALCVRALKGKAIPAFPGWGGLDDDALLRSLAPAATGLAALEASIREQVEELRRRGVTWERIGAAMGVTRQAAQQRFGRAGAG